MDKLLSVIVPVYNVAPYLPKCLESILSQGDAVSQLICVNDGSTDNGLEILKQYAEKHSKIIIVDKPNGGLVSARKAGLKLSQTKYTMYIDSDDYVDDSYFSEMVKCAEQYGADIVTSGLYRNFGDNVLEDKEFVKPGLYARGSNLDELLNNLVIKDRFFTYGINDSLVTKLFRTDYLKEYQYLVDDRISVSEDTAVTFPALLNADKVYVTGKCWYHYCQREGSIMNMTHVENKESIEKLKLALDYVESFFYREGITESIKEQFKIFQMYMMLLSNASETITYSNGVLFPYGEIRKDEKIVVYGAGGFGRALHNFLVINSFNVVGWADKYVKNEKVIGLDELAQIEFDKILIGVLQGKTLASIREQFMKSNVTGEKIMYPNVNLV